MRSSYSVLVTVMVLVLATLVGGGCGGDNSTANALNTLPAAASTQPEPNQKIKGPLKKGIRLQRPPGAMPIPGGGPKSRENPHGIG
jgi:hypothetical protein